MPEENAPASLRIEIEMELDEFGNPRAPFVPNVRIEGDLGYGLYVHGEKHPSVTLRANRDGLKWLAYQLLSMAYSPKALSDSGFHVHVLDGQYALSRPGAVAVQINFADGE